MGFTRMRLAWIIPQLVRYLPSVRDETMRTLTTPGMKKLVDVLGAERAARYHDTLYSNVCIILADSRLSMLSERMVYIIKAASDARRDLWAKEASTCEDERMANDLARQYFNLGENRERGSTLAKAPDGKRKELRWFADRKAEVYRREPNGSTRLQQLPETWTFELEDAAAANDAMRVLVDCLLLPLFARCSAELEDFLKGGKEAGQKRLRERNGMRSSDAVHYQRMLAVVHVLSMLDVWRRNTSEFLVWCVRLHTKSNAVPYSARISIAYRVHTHHVPCARVPVFSPRVFTLCPSSRLLTNA